MKTNNVQENDNSIRADQSLEKLAKLRSFFDRAAGTINYDYKTGRVVSNVAVNGQPITCTSTFSSPLLAVLTDEDSIQELLEEWGTNDDRSDASQTGLLTTNCPQDEDEDIFEDDIDIFQQICRGSIQTDYTITDDLNKVHRLSTKMTF